MDIKTKLGIISKIAKVLENLSKSDALQIIDFLREQISGTGENQGSN